MTFAALSVLVVAAAASGFKAGLKPKGLMPTGWFTYSIQANQSSGLSFNATSNYTYFGTTPPVCSASTKLCAISVLVTVTTETHILIGPNGGERLVRPLEPISLTACSTMPPIRLGG